MPRSGRFLIGTLAALFVATAALPSVASGRDKFTARGEGTLSFGFGQPGSTANVHVDATSNFNGNFPTGKFSITDYSSEPRTYIDGDVVCLLVEGNRAAIAGEIRNMHPRPAPGFFTPHAVLIGGVDNDQQGTDLPDELSAFVLTFEHVFSADDMCRLSGFNSTPTDGEVEIVDN